MSETVPTRVLLADDHTLVRAGLRKLLESMSGVEVVAEAGTGRETLEALRKLEIDVVVMDLSMPEMNGLEATALALAEKPHLRILVLSMHRAEEYVLEALRVGASGYLLKEAATSELGLALEALRRGEVYLSPAISGHVARTAVAAATAKGLARPELSVPAASENADRLTPRQREILQMIAQGRSTKEIAYDLGLSAKTVETHRAQLMERLGIHDVAGLVRFAIRIGLVRADT
jgi:DNA-binding NarL/FixJ family response regulator